MSPSARRADLYVFWKSISLPAPTAAHAGSGAQPPLAGRDEPYVSRFNRKTSEPRNRGRLELRRALLRVQQDECNRVAETQSAELASGHLRLQIGRPQRRVVAPSTRTEGGRAAEV